MSVPSEQSGSSYPPSGKSKRSASGWNTRKARDAGRQAEYFESKQALESPSYTLGVLDDLQLQVHLAPPVQEKHAAMAFERFRGWLMRSLRPKSKWPAAVVVRKDRDKPAGHHWTSDLWRLQLGGTRAPDPFLSVTFTIFATTQQRFVLRGKARVIREVGAQLFPTTTAQASSAGSAQSHFAPQ